MIRKIKIIILTILFICINTMVVFAGDALSMIMSGQHEAFIVGEILSKKGDSFEIAVKKVINGRLNENKILLKDDFKYGNTENLPAVGDKCVLSLDRYSKDYKIAWGAYKTSFREDNTLELEKSVLYEGELVALQWYINSNGKEKDFRFEGSKVFLRKIDGTMIQIYPKDDKNAVEPTDIAKAKDIRNSEQVTSPNKKDIYIGIALIILTGGIIFVIIKRRKK